MLATDKQIKYLCALAAKVEKIKAINGPAKVIKATLPAYINWDSERKLGVTTLDACQYPNKGVQTIDLRL